MLPFQLNSKISLRSALSGMALIGSLLVALIAAASCQMPPPMQVLSTASTPIKTVAFGVPLPDERAIAFVSERRQPGNLDIWLMDLNTNTSVSITVDEAQDTQPRWSRDGRYLAFRSQWSDHHSSIRVYDTATGHLNEVDPGDNPYDFDWLPDSQGLVYSNGEFQIKHLYFSGKPGDTVVERGHAPHISPDGRQMAFVGSGPNDIGERLAVVEAETGAVNTVVDDPNRPEQGYVVGSFDWSTDNGRLVESRWGGRYSVPLIVIYDADLNSTAVLNIAPFVEPDQLGYGTNFCSPSWLPGSSDVSFVFQPEDSPQFCTGKLYVSDKELTTPYELVPGEDFASPAPSPDGRLIVVTRGFYKAGGNVVGSYRGRESSIWIMNRNGSDLTLLTDAPGYDGEATWRPTDSQLSN